MNNIGHLYQVLHSLNSGIAGMRADFEHLKVEVNSLRSKQESSSSSASATPDTTTTLIDALTSKVDGLEEAIKSSNTKIGEIEKAVSTTSSKVTTLQTDVQKTVKETVVPSPSITKEEVQTLIDQSIAILLGGLRPAGDLMVQDNPVFVPLASIDEVDENAIALSVKDEETMNGDVVIEAPVISTTTVETPKPKGRGGRKKKVTATA